MKKLLYFSLFCKAVSSTRFPLSHDAAILFAVLPYSASATAASAASTTGKHMFMTQYLVDSCGFDQEKATEGSKLLKGIQSPAATRLRPCFPQKCSRVTIGFLGTTSRRGSNPTLRCFGNVAWTAKSLRFHPMFILQKADTLKSLISHVEDLGVPQTSGMFHCTLCALFMVYPKKFKMLMDMFRNFGWSQGDFVAAIQKCPNLPGRSLKHLQRKMEFLINEAGYAFSYIGTRLVLLTLSLERRLIPRHRILATLSEYVISYRLPLGFQKKIKSNLRKRGGEIDEEATLLLPHLQNRSCHSFSSPPRCCPPLYRLALLGLGHRRHRRIHHREAHVHGPVPRRLMSLRPVERQEGLEASQGHPIPAAA
ncbi:hypothetical protein ZIOFF_043670 [Zingiber officinale]|uniref:Uncharacterized protein n=1 Tax=Zingiber officinale TaxID=94328 RepID=A0A8J5FXR5_ZINOF|nr:hypothetical protein ZIOFF_043670 [Zingiber officinale]